MNNLKKIRLAKKMTIVKMAEQLGVSKSLYEKLEYGDRKPSRNFLHKVKESFPEVDLNIFFKS